MRNISKTVKFNEEEMRLIEAMSEIKGITTSEFIRQSIQSDESLNDTIVLERIEDELKTLREERAERIEYVSAGFRVQESINQLISEFRIYGVNVNQIAKYLNGVKREEPTHDDMDEIRRANREVAKVIETIEEMRDGLWQLRK